MWTKVMKEFQSIVSVFIIVATLISIHPLARLG